MNSPHHPHHHHHHDVHQQRLLWFFSFCNQRSSSSSNSSSSSTHSHGNAVRRAITSRRAKTSSRNKFALQYQQQLQKQQRQSSNVFGMDIIEHTRRFGDLQDSVPSIVKSCTKFIEQHGIIFGIYRLSGMRLNITKLRNEFDKNPKITMIDSESITNDAHAVACVLKQYFRELPTPLLTFHMYEKFIDLFKQSGTSANIADDDDQFISATNPPQIKDFSRKYERPMTESPKHNEIGEKMNQISKVDEETFQDIDDEGDEDINCGDSARTLSDKANTPITKQPPVVTATSMQSASVTKPMNTSDDKTTSYTDRSATASVKQPIHQQSTTAIEITKNKKRQSRNNQKFTSSASDSQLISLSSVVTTTTNDIKYQVNLDELKQLLTQLPLAHYQTLKYLMRHLAVIAKNGQKTGMDSKNVAIVWAPNLLKPRELELSAGHLETLQVIGLQAVITEQLIKHHRFLFNYDSEPEDKVSECSVDQVENSEDIGLSNSSKEETQAECVTNSNQIQSAAGQNDD